MSKKTIKRRQKKSRKSPKPRSPELTEPVNVSTKDLAEPIRLNRLLSLAGIVSRRKADDLIMAGKVRVNGKVIREPGFRALWGKDKIHVGDVEVPGPNERVYIMLNKPFGYISALSDPAGRPVVTDLLENVEQRVYPVGRLDFDTMGLLLLTNDGQWAHRLTHPRYKVPRTYKVSVAGSMADSAIQALRTGVKIPGGPWVRGKVSLVSRNEKQTVLRMTITQGISRQVRKMVEAAGYRVVHLIRIGFGVLTLDDLKVGQYRYLETVEVEKMKKLVGLDNE